MCRLSPKRRSGELACSVASLNRYGRSGRFLSRSHIERREKPFPIASCRCYEDLSIPRLLSRSERPEADVSPRIGLFFLELARPNRLENRRPDRPVSARHDSGVQTETSVGKPVFPLSTASSPPFSKALPITTPVPCHRHRPHERPSCQPDTTLVFHQARRFSRRFCLLTLCPVR